MKAAQKVAVGYAVAAALGVAAVWLHGVLSRLPEPEATGGMAAFGDLVLFLAVFSVAAVPPTVMIMRHLAGIAAFWVVWACTGVFVALSGLVASAFIVLPELSRASHYPNVAMAAPLRILAGGPMFLAFALSAFFSPAGRCRAVFLGCAAVELVGSGAAIGKWALGL
ncbi:MAG: hypothetical protein AB7I59_29580 [Geminicoccaceae bacterium]